MPWQVPSPIWRLPVQGVRLFSCLEYWRCVAAVALAPPQKTFRSPAAQWRPRFASKFALLTRRPFRNMGGRENRRHRRPGKPAAKDGGAFNSPLGSNRLGVESPVRLLNVKSPLGTVFPMLPQNGRPLWFTLRAAFMFPGGVTLDLT
jgi:hypothetical protein